ncbi:hypothetical protein OF83DRAFT_353775 [Amylostereum chailletii]|nr:hypothetical protein OF83DRAFT_353775 [Amylostereum chailletii]
MARRGKVLLSVSIFAHLQLTLTSHRDDAPVEDVVPHEIAGPGNLQTGLAPQDQVSNRKSNVTSHMIDLEELANSVVSQPSRNRAASIASTMSVSDSGTVVSSLHVDGLGKLNAFSDDPVEPPSSDMIIAEHLRAMGQYRHQLFVEAKAREEMQRRIDALQARAEEAERRADSLEQKRKAEVKEAAEAEDNSRRKRRKLKKEVLDLEDRLMGYKHLADERKEKLYKARESENVVIKRLLDLVGGDGKELSGNIEDHVDGTCIQRSHAFPTRTESVVRIPLRRGGLCARAQKKPLS